jgi:tetratricopeptide (TPR) repeat protein
MDAMSVLRRLACVTVLGCLLPLVAHAASVTDDASRARELMKGGNLQGALLLYEQLVMREPTNAEFAEQLAFCLVAKMTDLPAGEERNTLISRARFEAERARTLGDKSDLLGMMLEHLNSDDIATPPIRDGRMQAAEEAFMRGDYDKALAGYEAIAASDPKSYEARLFAGDVLYKRGNTKTAAEWFQKAIDVNPDIETAYRYWGDAVARSGDDAGALPYYIRAVVAEPYERQSWSGLQQWAKRNGALLQQPRIRMPSAAASTKKGEKGVIVGLDPSFLTDKEAGATWLIYSVVRSGWVSGKFMEKNPEAKVYRHSLEEELDSVGQALALIPGKQGDSKPVPDSLQELVRLVDEDMLASYFLISAADEGLAQDYDSYRQQHREQLAAYIDKYVIRRGKAVE